MNGQYLAEETPIQSPRLWPNERLLAEIDRIATGISSTDEKAFAASATVVAVRAAKLTLYSNELARRASDRAATAADREAASNRRLTRWAIGIAVGSLVIAIVQAVMGYLALPK